LLTLCATLGIMLWLRPTYVERNPVVGDRAGEVRAGLDPNSAPLADLMALPNMGERRARAIIETREALRAADPSQPPFQTPLDLEKVPGIGPVMREHFTPYLTFPEDDE
jgi:DNA uptake protein ComE-like DNA-binding protein